MVVLNVESIFINISLEDMDNIINDLLFTTDKVHNFEKDELLEFFKYMIIFLNNSC